MTASEEVPAEAEYKPSEKAVDISPNEDGGVLKEIIKEGEGDMVPCYGSTVYVHYEGKLTDGTVFDSSKNTGKPFKFTLGTETVIKAWDIGVATMKKGEVAILTCKPEYAYGGRGSPPKIPPDATLLFEVNLLSWEPGDLSKAKDGGILRIQTFTVGKGHSMPNDGALVEVHITGKFEGKIFDDRDLSFDLGEGCEFDVIKGVEKALKKFKKGEKSVLEIKPQYAFGEKGSEKFGIPPNAVVEYTVELKNFEQTKRTWDMTAEERLSQAKLLKEKATKYFKEEKYPMAKMFYTRLIEYIDSDSGFDEGVEENERKALLLAVHLNLGLVHLKMNQCYQAKEECDLALSLDPANVKGMFRRGQAYLGMGEPEKAKADFEEIIKIEPSNKLAASQIAICLNKVKQYREKEKKIYANMFEKFARRDKEKEESTTTREADTMKVLGEWGRDERDREPTEFEQENPDILMLNKNDEFQNM